MQVMSPLRIQREKTHGSYTDNNDEYMQLLDSMDFKVKSLAHAAVLQKYCRIVNGDITFADHYEDIMGYCLCDLECRYGIETLEVIGHSVVMRGNSYGAMTSYIPESLSISCISDPHAFDTPHSIATIYWYAFDRLRLINGLVAVLDTGGVLTDGLGIEIGDYVLASKYDDGDPNDHWAIGFYAGLTAPHYDPPRFDVVDGDGRKFRGNGFRRVEKISGERGEWMLKHVREIELSCRSVWYFATCPMDGG